MEDSEPSDSALLAQYARFGDDKAFDQLFKRYRRLVFRASKAVLDDDESAEDAVGAVPLQGRSSISARSFAKVIAFRKKRAP
jgi:hypothetical protein